MKAHTKHKAVSALGDPLVPRVPKVLGAPSPRATAQRPPQLWALRSYPCRSFVFALSLLLSIQLQAQVLTLDSVLILIDQNNPMLQEYDSKVKALNEYAAGAKSWMAPMVGGGTFMTPYANQMLMDERDKGAWMLSVEQSIPNPAKLNANKN